MLILSKKISRIVRKHYETKLIVAEPGLVVGKRRSEYELAQRFNGEIISGDSRCLQNRNLNIGEPWGGK